MPQERLPLKSAQVLKFTGTCHVKMKVFLGINGSSPLAPKPKAPEGSRTDFKLELSATVKTKRTRTCPRDQGRTGRTKTETEKGIPNHTRVSKIHQVSHSGQSKSPFASLLSSAHQLGWALAMVIKQAVVDTAYRQASSTRSVARPQKAPGTQPQVLDCLHSRHPTHRVMELVT